MNIGVILLPIEYCLILPIDEGFTISVPIQIGNIFHIINQVGW